MDDQGRGGEGGVATEVDVEVFEGDRFRTLGEVVVNDLQDNLGLVLAGFHHDHTVDLDEVHTGLCRAEHRQLQGVRLIGHGPDDGEGRFVAPLHDHRVPEEHRGTPDAGRCLDVRPVGGEAPPFQKDGAVVGRVPGIGDGDFDVVRLSAEDLGRSGQNHGEPIELDRGRVIVAVVVDVVL